ncbi:MAG: hypothetical protein JWP14_882 [Frankiales bacterium]|nr:hypothetical protein [Frankiales bacterium]
MIWDIPRRVRVLALTGRLGNSSESVVPGCWKTLTSGSRPCIRLQAISHSWLTVATCIRRAIDRRMILLTRKVRRAVLTSIAFVGAALLMTLTSPTASATNVVNGQWRGRAVLGSFTDAQGRPFNGVSGTLYARSNYVATTVVAGDIYLSGSDGSFIQVGVAQGNFGGTRVDCTTPDAGFFSAPHAFIGYQRAGDRCEALIDEGTLGVLGYRNFQILQQADSSFKIYLDGTLLFSSVTGFPASFNPGVVAEADDSCSMMYVRANTSASPYDTLMRKAAGDSVWRLWGAKSDSQTVYYNLNTYYVTNEPNPASPAEFLFYGPVNPPPGDCP